jgi:hypothetical protein
MQLVGGSFFAALLKVVRSNREAYQTLTAPHVPFQQ